MVEDEDTFGSFSFVSNTNQININNKNEDDDDEDWGNFVESPIKSNIAPLNNTLSRPKGPLPLSLFGLNDDNDDDDKEERSGANGSTGNHNGFSFGKNSNVGQNNGILGLNASGLSSGSDFVCKSGDFLGVGTGILRGLSLDSGFVSKSGDFSGLGTGNVSGLSSDSGFVHRSGDFSGLGSGNLSGLSSDLGFVRKSGDFSGLGAGNLSGLSLDSGFVHRSGDFSGLGTENVSGLSPDSGFVDKSGDFSGVGTGKLSGLGSDSGFVHKSGDFLGLGTSSFSGLGSNLAMDPVNNGEHLNHGLFGEKYDNRSGQIENVSGLISDSDLLVKSRSFSGIGNGSLGNGNLSGLGSNSDLFANSRDFSGLGKRDLSGLGLNSDLFAKSTSFSSLGRGNLSGSSSNLDMFSVNNNGLSFSSDLFDVKIGDHNPQKKDTNVSSLKPDVDLFIRHNENNLVSLHSNLNGSVLNTVPPSENEEFEGDDDAWEFKDAFSESNVDKGINNKVNGNNQEYSKVTGTSTQAVNGSHESIYFPSATNGISVNSLETDFSFDFTRSAVAQNGLSSGSFFNSEQSGFDTGMKSDPLDSDEMFGDFHGALSGNGLKEEDAPMTSNGSPSVVEVLPSNGKAQVNETRTNNHNKALPLSLFGDEELESDDHINAQEDFSYKSSSTRRDGINSEGSNYNIHDVISNLYRQPQQNPSVENLEKVTVNGLNSNPSDEVLSRIPDDFDEDFDDDYWEFKDASARTHGLELSSHLVFYRKLEEQLSVVCRYHLDNLKKARDAAAFSGEDAKLAGIEEEIQEAYKVLQEETSYFVIHSDNQTLRETSLDEFLEVLKEPKFEVLESQYQLSTKLLLAQKDLTSAIDAMKHTKSKLNILTIGSSEDQYNYVSTWYKIISVCAQELKHGSWIWKQLIENSLLSHTVSDPRGKDFVISLAEIYRVVNVLGASAKLFEPWILSVSTAIFSLLEDCYILWSSLRIEEALDILVNNEYQSTVKPLLESIKRIHDLDEFALQDVIFHKEMSTCRLSLLSSEVVPEINMVLWNGESYFVTLANLWVNLVNCDLPDLPRLQVAS